MYFAGIQMAHVYEAMTIIRDISESDVLREAVERCDATTKTSVKKLCDFLNSDDYKILLRIRNDLSFHYPVKLTVRAIGRIAKKSPEDTSRVTLGTERLDWYFELADKVVETIMVRDIMRIPEGADARREANITVDRLWDMQLMFADFAGYFIKQHAR